MGRDFETPRGDMDDPFEGATANCPTCLEPLTPHLGAWWCDGCERDVQITDDP